MSSAHQVVFGLVAFVVATVLGRLGRVRPLQMHAAKREYLVTFYVWVPVEHRPDGRFVGASVITRHANERAFVAVIRTAWPLLLGANVPAPGALAGLANERWKLDGGH
jgi:hypothetical protein